MPSSRDSEKLENPCLNNCYTKHYDRFLSRKEKFPGVSWVLYSAHFITEVERELKIRAFILRSDLDARFVREEKVVEAIGNGVVEEGRYSKESFWDEVDPFYEHFEFQILSEINRGKIWNGENENDYVADARVVADSDVFEVVTLLDIAEWFVALPPVPSKS